MQNIVCERKQNGEDFILIHSVTTVRFGNYPANILVTEQPQYSVAVCIFHIFSQSFTFALISFITSPRQIQRFFFVSFNKVACSISFS